MFAQRVEQERRIGEDQDQLIVELVGLAPASYVQLDAGRDEVVGK